MDDFEPERRSEFLRFAAFFANAFLVLFAIAALLQVLDVTMTPQVTNSALNTFALSIGVLLFPFFLIAIALVIFVPHLPKIVLAPPLLVLAWQLIGAPPLEWSYENRATQLPMDAVALGV